MQRRKDHKGRVLKDRESYRKSDGLYMYRWGSGKQRCYLYSKDLDVLREKEKAIIRDELDGIKCDNINATVSDVYDIWKKTKTGVRDSTKVNYYYYYEHYIEEELGLKRIRLVRKSDIKICKALPFFQKRCYTLF